MTDFMTDPVLTMLVDKIDTGFREVNRRFDQVDTRVDRIVDEVSDVRENGCAKFETHRELLTAGGGLSRRSVVGYSVAGGSTLAGLIELAKAAVGHFWGKA